MFFDERLAYVRKQYQEERAKTSQSVIDMTIFGGITCVLNEYPQLLERLNPDPNILIIGPGGKTPYEVYELTAHLESRGIDYTLTVLDISEQVLDNVNRIRRMEVDMEKQKIRDPTLEIFEQAWEVYHTLLGLDYDDNRNYGKIETAPLPNGFLEKLTKGKVSFIQGDVAVTDLGSMFDLIVSRNVLYQIYYFGQMLTFDNFRNSMLVGSLLWVNDGRDLIHNFRPDLSGWLTESWLDYFGFDQGKVIYQDKGDHQELLFEKIK